MITVYHCGECNRWFSREDLKTKKIDLEDFYGVGELKGHHSKEISVCPDCGSADDLTEETVFDADDVCSLLNEREERIESLQRKFGGKAERGK